MYTSLIVFYLFLQTHSHTPAQTLTHTDSCTHLPIPLNSIITDLFADSELIFFMKDKFQNFSNTKFKNKLLTKLATWFQYKYLFKKFQTCTYTYDDTYDIGNAENIH